MERLGWEERGDEEDSTKLLRTRALDLAGSSGNQAVLDQVKERHEAGLIPANQRFMMFKLMVQYHGAYDDVKQRFFDASSSTEKLQALRALGTGRPWETLQFALFDDAVRDQDLALAYAGVVCCQQGQVVAWEFLKENWLAHQQACDGANLLLQRIITCCTSSFYSAMRLEEVERFFQENSAPEAARTIQLSLESIRRNMAWRERDYPFLQTFTRS